MASEHLVVQEGKIGGSCAEFVFQSDSFDLPEFKNFNYGSVFKFRDFVARLYAFKLQGSMPDLML